MEKEDILNIFRKNKSTKVGEFGQIYPPILSNLSKSKNKVVILEIGQRRGETFQTLLDVIPNGIIYGIDIGDTDYKELNVKKRLEDYGGERARLFVGSQDDEDLLNKIGKEVKEKYGGFDLVMDDGGHHMKHQLTSLKVLSSYMKPISKYIIEDIETSYYKEFGGGPIGTPNTFINLLKNLIDVINRDFTEGQYKSKEIVKKRGERKRRDVVDFSIINNDDKIFSMEIFPNCAILNFGYKELYMTSR